MVRNKWPRISYFRIISGKDSNPQEKDIINSIVVKPKFLKTSN